MLTAILIAVAVVLALVVVSLAVTREPGSVASGPGSADPGRLLNDALSAGSPIYVLVHSSTWESCIEIAAVAADVMPDYEGRIVFVDALTTDPNAAPVFDRYPGRYIPTSIFVDDSGEAVETFVGPLDEGQLREKLDSLL